MLSLFGGWASTSIFRNSQHSPLHHNISWQFSYPCCPSQGICPPCAVQTLVSLSGNNWSVGWSCCSASLCYIWDSVVHEYWTLCHYAVGAAYIIGSALCGISLLTMAAITVDRLFALLSGLRCKECVTLKSVYIIIASFWVLCLVASLCTIFDQRIIALCTYILIPLSLLISLASYTKIFRTLRNHQEQVQDHVQQQPSQPSALNMARYRKAVHSALWVQSVLVVCYTRYPIVRIVVTYSRTYSSHLGVALAMAVILVYVNSTLNLFLYRWKISEVRRAMKQTIRQALCCPWS